MNSRACSQRVSGKLVQVNSDHSLRVKCFQFKMWTLVVKRQPQVGRHSRLKYFMNKNLIFIFFPVLSTPFFECVLNVASVYKSLLFVLSLRSDKDRPAWHGQGSQRTLPGCDSSQRHGRTDGRTLRNHDGQHHPLGRERQPAALH